MDASPHPGQGYILVVEDDPQLSEIIRSVLEDEGWTTEGALDGAQGVATAAQKEPALVVLDMNLPKLHGEAVAEQLHTLYGAIPILVVTANMSVVASARKVHAFACLRKPFDLETLITCVRTGLTSRPDSQHWPYAGSA